MKVLVTGGAGFIGSAVLPKLLAASHAVVNVDKLTYAADPESLAGLDASPGYAFEKADVCDGEAMRAIFAKHDPDAVLHLAAETHVDRSIDVPSEFVRTNVVGTFTMLDVARAHWAALASSRRDAFRFVHVSTDEVFGSRGPGEWTTPATPYAPSSPYAASKAGGDHLVRAWHVTYGFPSIVMHPSNNFGPRQFPEKLVPLVTLNALEGKPLPVYGRGENERDWLFVEDHADALVRAVERGRAGATYLVGARNPRRNVDVVRAVCAIVDEIAPSETRGQCEALLSYVTDRPGHDLRYAGDPSACERDLAWAPKHSFDEALRATVAWYLENRAWCERVARRGYSRERLGLGRP